MNLAMRLFSISTAIASVFAAPNADAQPRRYDLPYHHQEISGPNRPGLIQLKRDIRDVYGEDVDLRSDQLMRVVLVAKSRAGFGRASLSVNGEELVIPAAQGGPNPNVAYERNNPETYHRLDFQRIDPNNTRGPWQIRFQGNIKVLRVVVVTRDREDFPPPPGPGFSIRDLNWSSAGPVGRFCTQFIEPADPHTWNDNFLCSERDYGFRFSHAGPIPGMHCLSVNEPADPNTWGDNYLCSPRDYGLVWSTAGAVRGMSCLQIQESADPHTWNDNFLCSPR